MELKKLKEKLLANDVFRQEYYKQDLAMMMGEMVIDARVRLGLTQAELAKRVGTKQPSIARLENGDRVPDLKFLARIAKSLGMYLIPPKFAVSVQIKKSKKSGKNIRFLRVKPLTKNSLHSF
jgi:transcriptional regulator with XRE-family HTH domain